MKRYVYRLNQTQTICNGDNIRNRERMLKMKWQSDQKTFMELLKQVTVSGKRKFRLKELK